jgi:dolichyl-diphosphooligosaccharide--protein glycosyltransferase
MALYALKDHKINFKEYATLKFPILYGIICGIGYLLDLLTMTTMIGFGLFTAIFTLIQLITNHRSGKPTEHLLVLNMITFTVITMGMLIYGVQNLSFSFYSYFFGVLCVHLSLIIRASVLYAIPQMLAKKKILVVLLPHIPYSANHNCDGHPFNGRIIPLHLNN